MVQADEQREQQENGDKVASFRVELFLWANGLANLDKFSKSDPICVVELNLDTQKRHENGDWMQIDRTEPIMNELNPKWAKKVLVDFEPDKPQELRFSCYDIDSDKNALTYHDFLGRCQCLLADILHAPNGTLKMRLKKVTGAFAKGEFSVHAEKVPNGAEPMVHFEVRGLLSSPAQKQHHAIVGNKGATMIKPTPPTAYLEFYRLAEEKEDAGNGRAENSASPPPLMVHRTEKVKSNWYPQWQNFQVPLRLLSHGQRGRDFLVHCLDKEANESHRLIGVLRTSVDRLTVDHRWRVELANVEKENQNVLAKASPSRIRLDPTKKQGHLHFIHVRLDSAGGKVI